MWDWRVLQEYGYVASTAFKPFVSQFSLLEHFNSQPLSVLCCQKKEALLCVKTLSQQNVERIRHLPSFMRYTQKCSHQ